jgi:hypothetical protein
VSQQLKECQGNDGIARYSIQLATRIADFSQQLVRNQTLSATDATDIADQLSQQVAHRNDFYRLVKQRYRNEILWLLEQSPFDEATKNLIIKQYEIFLRELLTGIKSRKKPELEAIAKKYTKLWFVSEAHHSIIKNQLSAKNTNFDAAKLSALQSDLKLKNHDEVRQMVAHAFLSRVAEPVRALSTLLQIYNESRELMNQAMRLRMTVYETSTKKKPEKWTDLIDKKWLKEIPVLDFNGEKPEIDRATGLINWRS